MPAAKQPSGRICRTADEAFRAGWEDAQTDRPLSPDEIRRLARLLRLHLDVTPAEAIKSA